MIEFIAHASIIGAVVCASILCVGMYVDLIKAGADIDREDDGE